MRTRRSKAIALLGLSLVLAAVWVFWPHRGPTGDRLLDRLLAKLTARKAWYYERLETSPRWRRIAPHAWQRKAVAAEGNILIGRWQAAESLASLGTNAWLAVPALFAALDQKELSIAVSAGSVLARVEVTRHPDWPTWKKWLQGRPRPGKAFNYYLTRPNQFGQAYDTNHWRFALTGLAAIGPTAAEAIPAAAAILKSRDHHPLWLAAVHALMAMRAQSSAYVPVLIAAFDDPQEWPQARATSLRGLVMADPSNVDIRANIRHLALTASHDEKALVRLAGLEALWNLRIPAAEFLPDLAALLDHKLIAVRSGAVQLVLEMGEAARSLQSKVEQMAGSDPDEGVRRLAGIASKSLALEPNPGLTSRAERLPAQP